MSSLLILERRVRSLTPTCFLRDVSKTALRTTALPEACLPEALGAAAAALRPARFVTAWDTSARRQHGRGREGGRIKRRGEERVPFARMWHEITLRDADDRQRRGSAGREQQTGATGQRAVRGGEGAAGDVGRVAATANFLGVCACRSQRFLAQPASLPAATKTLR